MHVFVQAKLVLPCRDFEVCPLAQFHIPPFHPDDSCRILCRLKPAGSIGADVASTSLGRLHRMPWKFAGVDPEHETDPPAVVRGKQLGLPEDVESEGWSKGRQ
jgi:hypothetical protein